MGSPPAFEVATIKLWVPGVYMREASTGDDNPFVTMGSVEMLIASAYNISPMSSRIFGGPQWIGSLNNMYVVQGKIPGDYFVQMKYMNLDERKEVVRSMLRSLLAERFHLQAHLETRQLPVYELTIAKGGPRLPSPIDNDAGVDGIKPRAGSTVGLLTKEGVVVRNRTLDSMLGFGWFGLGDRPIINKTGLTGKYNLTIHWIPEESSSGNPDPAAIPKAPEGQASIFTVLQEQLGLKLSPATGPVSVLVIDRVERPSPN